MSRVTKRTVVIFLHTKKPNPHMMITRIVTVILTETMMVLHVSNYFLL